MLEKSFFIQQLSQSNGGVSPASGRRLQHITPKRFCQWFLASVQRFFDCLYINNSIHRFYPERCQSNFRFFPIQPRYKSKAPQTKTHGTLAGQNENNCETIASCRYYKVIVTPSSSYNYRGSPHFECWAPAFFRSRLTENPLVFG